MARCTQSLNDPHRRVLVEALVPTLEMTEPLRSFSNQSEGQGPGGVLSKTWVESLIAHLPAALLLLPLPNALPMVSH
jgi:hypothetical protein